MVKQSDWGTNKPARQLSPQWRGIQVLGDPFPTPSKPQGLPEKLLISYYLTLQRSLPFFNQTFHKVDTFMSLSQVFL